jgi:outer membrane protein TolC
MNPALGPRLACLAALALSLGARANPEARGGLSVREAAALAVSRSEELRFGERRLVEEAHALKLGYRAFLPQLGLKYSDSSEVELNSGDSFQKSLSASLEQPLFDGGRALAALKVSREDLRAGRAALVRNRREAAVEAYWAVQEKRDELASSRAALEASAAERRIVEKEVELGRAREYDLSEIRLSEIELRADAANLSLEASQAERLLAQSLRLGKAGLPELSDGIDVGYDGVDFDPARLSAFAASRNPALLESRINQDRKAAQANAAQFSWIPQISLNASYGVGGRDFPLTQASWSVSLNLTFQDPLVSGSSSFSPSSSSQDEWASAGAASLDLFPDPKALTDRALSRLEAVAARTAYRRALAEVGPSFIDLAKEYGMKRELRALGAERLSAAERAAALSRARVELGQATRAELVSAEMAVGKARLGLIRAAASLLKAERELESFMDIEPGSFARIAKGEEK